MVDMLCQNTGMIEEPSSEESVERKPYYRKIGLANLFAATGGYHNHYGILSS